MLNTLRNTLYLPMIFDYDANPQVIEDRTCLYLVWRWNHHNLNIPFVHGRSVKSVRATEERRLAAPYKPSRCAETGSLWASPRAWLNGPTNSNCDFWLYNPIPRAFSCHWESLGERDQRVFSLTTGMPATYRDEAFRPVERFCLVTI